MSKLRTRRSFIKVTVLGAGVAATTALLAGCAAPPASSPAGAKPTAAPTGGGPAPTSAPAAGAPAAAPAAKAAAPAQPAVPAAAGAAGTVRKGGVLVHSFVEQVGGFDPHVSSNLYCQWVFEHIYDTLLRMDRDGNPIPGLATAWEQPDPLTYVFKLRPGVKWHHGRELTAEDVKFSLERQADPKVAGMNQTIYAEIAAIEIPDPSTVRVRLKGPFAPFLTYLSSPREGNIVARDFTEKAGDLKAQASGTGPFKFVEYAAGSHLKLARNPDYWEAGKPNVDEITIKYIEDEQSRVAAVRTGAADLIRADLPETIRPLQADRNVVLYPTKPLYTTQMMLNNARPPLTDVRVRRAISLAIDRAEMVKTLTLGEGAVSGYIAGGDAFYSVPDPTTLPYYKPDVDKAKALLAEAGVAPGTKLTLKVLPEELFVSAGEMIQRYLQKIGIELEVLKLERAALIQAFRTVDHETLLNGFQSTVDPDTFLYRTMHSKSTGTWTNVKSPELDALLEKGRTVSAPAERQTIYRDIQTMVADQAFQITLFARPGIVDVARPHVKGLWPMDKRIGHADQFRDVWLDK